jgi:hypothetical protein
VWEPQVREMTERLAPSAGKPVSTLCVVGRRKGCGHAGVLGEEGEGEGMNGVGGGGRQHKQATPKILDRQPHHMDALLHLCVCLQTVCLPTNSVGPTAAFWSATSWHHALPLTHPSPHLLSTMATPTSGWLGS